MATYSLRSGDAGAARLSVLANVHEQGTLQLFDRLHVAASARCLDVGCGIGAVTRLLATRFAGDLGSALGVDVDRHYLEIARTDAGSFRPAIEFAHVAVHDLDAVAVYDLVYARFLLSHLREPRAALANMIRAAKPGAVVAVEDVDFGGAFCHPPSSDFDRYLGWYAEMTRGNGGDPNFGRGLFRMVVDLGIADPELSVVQPTFTAGAGKQLAPTTLEHIGQTLVARNIASAEQLRATLDGLRDYVSDPTTVLSMPRIFQVSGRVR